MNSISIATRGYISNTPLIAIALKGYVDGSGQKLITYNHVIRNRQIRIGRVR